jgi:hypothetical protein
MTDEELLLGAGFAPDTTDEEVEAMANLSASALQTCLTSGGFWAATGELGLDLPEVDERRFAILGTEANRKFYSP